MGGGEAGVQGQLTLNYSAADHQGDGLYSTSLAHAPLPAVRQFSYLQFWQKEPVSKEVKANTAPKITPAEDTWILFEHAISSSRLHDGLQSNVFRTLHWFAKCLNPRNTFIWLFR